MTKKISELPNTGTALTGTELVPIVQGGVTKRVFSNLFTIPADLASTASGKGAALVGFIQTGTGAVSRTVLGKTRESVSLADFGAVGDGSTSDTTAIQAALDSDHYEIDGQGLTYKFTSNLVSTKAHKLRNIVLKPVGTTTNVPAIEFTGSEGSPITPSADITAGDTSFTTASPGSFAEDQWVFFLSTKDFSSTTKSGELNRVKSISGGTINLYSPLALGYAAADSFTVTPLNMLTGVRFEDVRCVGDAGVDNLSAFWFDRCDDVVLNNPVTTDCDYTHILFERCSRFRVFGGTGDRTGVNEGLDYGIVASRGCYDGKVIGYSGTDMRHTISIGGSEGVSRFIYGIGCHAEGSLDAGFDCHPSAIEHGFINCTVNMSSDAAENDGIISQGTEFLAIGNVVKGVHRHGVLWQPVNSISTLRLIGKIADNDVTGVAGDRAYEATTSTSAAPIQSISITNNTSNGFDRLVEVYAATTNIERASVVGNVGRNCAAKGVFFRADAGLEISGGEVSGNQVENVGSALEAFYMQGVSTGRIKNVGLGKNHGYGVGTGLRVANTDNVTTDGTNVWANTTLAVSIDTGSTGLNIRETNAGLTVIRQAATIASGVVTIDNPLRQILRVDTESAAATDDLDTINGGYAGQVIKVVTTSSARDVVAKDGTGNLKLGGDRTLSNAEDVLTLYYDGTNWFEQSFADNGA